MTIASDADAVAALQEGAASIQAALVYWETAHPSDEVTSLHGLLYRMALRAEAITGATPGSVSNPQPQDGGQPKS